jgi:hypothetical protein
MLFLSFAAATASAMQPAPVYDTDLLLACSAVLGERPERPGLLIADEGQVEDGLRSVRVTIRETGAFMRIYHDAGSERIARARAACLGEQIDAVARAVGDKRQRAEWASVVFTQDPDYIPPRGSDLATRWVIQVAPNGTLNLISHYMVVSTLPHEQVHSWQKRNGASPPRWIAEGHATWIASRINPAFDPIVAAKTNRSRQNALAAFQGPLNLAQWGSVKPKREAIMRQVSQEDRARMEADPDYHPTGTFTFRPDDFETDMTSNEASYPASSAIFEGLAQRHGEKAVRAWIAELTASRGEIGPEGVAQSIGRHFRGERASEILR